MIRQTILCLAVIFGFSCSGNQDPKGDFSIIPYPNRIETHSDRFLTVDKQMVVGIPTPFDKSEVILDYLKERLGGWGLEQTVASSETNFDLVVDASLPDEAYALEIDGRKITLKANQEGAGFFYGLQTLLQMFPPEADGQVMLPCTSIHDAPRFPYRGLMLDVARNFQSKETVLKFIDLMSVYKMNRLHLHLTDDQGWRIEIKKYPKLTEVGSARSQTMVGHSDYYYPRRFDGIPKQGYYTQEDIKEMVRYAAKHFITIVPEVEMPGHSSAALAAYPQYACGLGKTYVVRDYMDIFDEVYCPHEATFRFLQDVLTEVMELFPSEYIHIGGDECPKKAWKACPRCQALIKKEKLKDEHELQSWFIHRIEQFVNSKGKNIIGWDEILEGGLAPHATVMSWRGEEGGVTAARMKHGVIMTPGDYCYIDHYQEDPEFAPLAIGSYLPLDSVYAYNPLPTQLSKEEQQYIIGTQANLWGEYIQTPEYLEYMAFPRVLAMAEVQWTAAENKDVQSFLRRMKKNFDWLDRKGVHACRNYYEVSFQGAWKEASSAYEVNLRTLCPEGEIRYALNDSLESNFLVYTSPLQLDEETEVFAAVYVDKRRMGAVTHKRFVVNKATGCEYTCEPQAAWEHIHKGHGLTDGWRGYPKDMRQWTGFSGDSLQITLRLHKEESISQVDLATLWRPWNTLWPTRGIEVAVSLDGKTYHPVAQCKPEYDFTRTEGTRFPVSVSFDEARARFVRITLQGGGKCLEGYFNAGGQSELAVDEIEIY